MLARRSGLPIGYPKMSYTPEVQVGRSVSSSHSHALMRARSWPDRIGAREPRPTEAWQHGLLHFSSNIRQHFENLLMCLWTMAAILTNSILPPAAGRGRPQISKTDAFLGRRLVDTIGL